MGLVGWLLLFMFYQCILGQQLTCPNSPPLTHGPQCTAACGGLDPDAVCLCQGTTLTCSCSSGYVLGQDGKCRDIDECSLGFCTRSGDSAATCSNVPGSFMCTCSSDYIFLNGTCLHLGLFTKNNAGTVMKKRIFNKYQSWASKFTNLSGIGIGIDKNKFPLGNTIIGLEKGNFSLGNAIVGIDKGNFSLGNAIIGIDKGNFTVGNDVSIVLGTGAKVLVALVLIGVIAAAATALAVSLSTSLSFIDCRKRSDSENLLQRISRSVKCKGYEEYYDEGLVDYIGEYQAQQQGYNELLDYKRKGRNELVEKKSKVNAR